MLPDPPVYLSATFNAGGSFWRLDFGAAILSAPAVPVLTNWVLDPATSPISPTSITVAAGDVRLINPAFTGAESVVEYTHTPGDNYPSATGSSLDSFMGAL